MEEKATQRRQNFSLCLQQQISKVLSTLLIAVAQNTTKFFSNNFTINGCQQRNGNVDTGSNTKIYGDKKSLKKKKHF